MKMNTFFITALLGAVMLSVTCLQVQASQGWTDWAKSGIGSAISSVRGMYGKMPNVSEAMTNAISSMSLVSKEKLLMAIGVSLLGTAGAVNLYKWYHGYRLQQCIEQIKKSA